MIDLFTKLLSRQRANNQPRSVFSPYQVAETPEERVGQHEFPSLLNLLRNGLINIVSG